jgi:mannose-1-phosphate guanylyltransferase
MQQGEFWTIVLAAGDGTRVRDLTRNGDGEAIPKQFYAPDGRRSMLRRTLDRTAPLGSLERVVVVVAEQHRRWWTEELADLPPENIVVQPQNRGTAAGILLPFLEVVRRDPDARVMIVPSDHHIEHEDVLASAILEAMQATRIDRSRIVLLGTRPDDSGRDYGWIVPSAEVAVERTRGIHAFIEKPDADTAKGLAAAGALVNTFILLADAQAMLGLYRSAAPDLLDGFLQHDAVETPLTTLYEALPRCDFSREMLERTPEMLAVQPVPDCGWTDLGTPARLQRHRLRESVPHPVAADAAPAGHYFG